MDAPIQKEARMGTEVNKPKKMAVLQPPPIFHESQRGTPTIREISRIVEKLSLPEASAGRGAFLIAGD